MQNDFSAIDTPVAQAAERLLGCELIRTVHGSAIRVRIVETEAYDSTDAASHSYHGRTARNDVMFKPAGHLYVYFTYGLHYCCNIVTGNDKSGAAVLIRAVEPLTGEDTMKRFRSKTGLELCNGPAKLCQALAIDRQLNGHNLHVTPLKLQLMPTLSSAAITKTTRVGIKKAQNMPWRFYITNNPYVSRL